MPDIVTLSKALTGGTLPLAATVARQQVFEAFWSDDPTQALMHGPTYMANALACAAANASLDLFEREPRLAQVGSHFRAADARAWRHAAACRASRMCGSWARSAWSSSSGSPNLERAARAFRGGGRVHPAVRHDRLSDAAPSRSHRMSRATLTTAVVRVLRRREPVAEVLVAATHQRMVAAARKPTAVPCRSYSSARSIFTVANLADRSGRRLCHIDRAVDLRRVALADGPWPLSARPRR